MPLSKPWIRVIDRCRQAGLQKSFIRRGKRNTGPSKGENVNMNALTKVLRGLPYCVSDLEAAVSLQRARELLSTDWCTIRRYGKNNCLQPSQLIFWGYLPSSSFGRARGALRCYGKP